jgi:DNA-directed RNA polymerase specialized sigma24 family protein
LLRAERVSAVRAALARLSRKKAQLLLLRYSGLSYQEIAKAMKLNTNSIGRALVRATENFSVIYERQQRRNHTTTQLEEAKEQQ